MAESIRRAQLITPFGVGALSVLKNGSAVITCGLDSWFEREDIDRDEFEVHEPRLSKSLGVNNLYAPPEYRGSWLFYRSEERRNLEATVPFLLLPTWHFCTNCRRMQKLPLHHDATGRLPLCPHCRRGNGGPKLKQVRFLAMCEAGHIQDFPWVEWVHRSLTPSCRGPLRLRVHAGASLTAIRVSCDGCDVQPRDLGGIMNESRGQTDLSRKMVKGDAIYSCPGLRAWLGEFNEPCGLDLRATLRSATNLHFARTRSALFLPPEALTAGGSVDALVAEIQHMRDANPRFRVMDDVFRQSAGEQALEARINGIQDQLLHRGQASWRDKQIELALREVDASLAEESGGAVEERTWSEAVFRRQEFDVITSGVETEELLVRNVALSEYKERVFQAHFEDVFSGVSLLEKLRETRAYFGFTRVRPDESLSVAAARKALSREEQKWLPACVVRGEGILLRLREDALTSWETRVEAEGYLSRMEQVFESMRSANRVPPTAEFSPRFILLHTLAHCMMNRLVFDAGYSAASLRERLYSSTIEDTRMAALLIYTAAGDSEGTMGGLVEMGRPGRLEAVLRRTLEAAQWCSLDPVCMEVGHAHGQGPDGCNQAACHSCALVPETSCEHFNRFLDRTVLVGSADRPELGFFTSQRARA